MCHAPRCLILAASALLGLASSSLAQFRLPPTLAVPGTATSNVVAGDFNGDGLLDLAVSYSVSQPGGIAVFLGTGPGSFGPGLLSPTLGLFGQASTADLNGDGLTDFVATLPGFNGGVNVFIADGSGSFTKTFFGPEPNGVEGINIIFSGAALANVDTDADLDIVAVSHDYFGPFYLYVSFNDGAGNFAPWTKLLVPGFGDSGQIAVGDVTGDGAFDVMVTNDAQGGGVGVFVNDGLGAFTLASYVVTGGEPSAVALADFDADGKLDMAVSKATAGSLRILKGNGTGGFTFLADHPCPSSSDQVLAADLDGDGIRDLAVTGDGVWTYRGNGAGGFASPARYVAEGGLWPADLNVDGRLDLAAGNSELLNLGAGQLGAPRQFAAGTDSAALALGRFNAGAAWDIVTANADSNDVAILLGLGDGTFSAPQLFPAGTGPTSVAVGDWNGDAALDVAVANEISNDVSVLLGNGAGSLSPAGGFPVPAKPEAVAVGDLNSDGRPDLVVASNTAAAVTVFFGTGTGAFTPGPQYALPSGGLALAVGALNPDVRPDAVVGLLPGQGLATMLGNGVGGFLPLQAQPLGQGVALQLAVGDVNGDGNADVALGQSVLLGDGHGGMTAASTASQNAYGTAIADFTQDGMPDVALTDSRVRLMLNEGPAGFGLLQRSFTAGGTPRGVATADFDQNGRSDLAVGLDGPSGVAIFLDGAVPTGADLSLAVTHFPDPPPNLSTLTLTATVTNQGPLAASGVTLNLELADYAVFVSSTPGAPACQFIDGGAGPDVVSCTLGDLAPLGSTSVSVDVIAQQNFGTLTFHGVTGDFDPIDAHPVNNSVVHVVQVGTPADYSVSMTDTADPVAPGAAFSYVVDVVNQGADDVQGAVLFDALPAQVSFVSSNPPGCVAGTPVYCPLGMLASGASTQVTINVMAGTFTQVSNVVTVDNSGETDLFDNMAEETTHGALGIKRELAHGSALSESFPPGTPAERLYFVQQQPRASYEVVIDATSGDVAGTGQAISLQRLSANLSTLQDATAAGVGPSRSLRFENASDQSLVEQVIRVRSTGCSTGCGPGDAYRIRSWETTASIPRFNTIGTQTTVLVLENTTSGAIQGNAWLWDEDGQLVGTVPFALAGHELLRVDLATLVPGRKGAVTVSHDGPYGGLAGKGVALEPGTGFTFDTGLRYRPR